MSNTRRPRGTRPFAIEPRAATRYVSERSGPDSSVSVTSRKNPSTTFERVMNQLKALALSLAAVPAIGYAVTTPPIEKAPKESCSNIEWNPAFLKDYPTAPAACRNVTVKDGVKYA